MKLSLTAALLLFGARAFADCPPIAVTTTDDSPTCTASKCGFRGALSLANACAGTTITLPAGKFVINSTPLTPLAANVAMRIVGVGKAATVLDGGGNLRVLLVAGSPTTISGLTLQNGNAGTADGGGLSITGSATLQDVAVNNCSAKNGGGIAVTGSLTASGLVVSGNTATTSGGGVFVGGASANVTLDQATLSGNNSGAAGGGLYQNLGVLTLTNLTSSGNTAVGSGGAVAVDGISSIETWAGVTLAKNQAQGQGGGLFIDADQDKLVLSQTLIAQNTATSSDDDCFTGVALASAGEGNNLIQSASAHCLLPGNASDQPGADPKLGPLADNGGSVQTHALLAGSQAIDSGGIAPLLATDARGVSRPQGAFADIGAFESGVTTLQISEASVPQSALAGTSAVHVYELTNAGAVPALGVAATASGTLLAFGASQGNCTTSACTLGVIDIGGHATLSLLVAGNLQSSVQVSGDNLSALTASESTTALPAADLSVTAVPSSSAFALTDSVTLSVTVLNRGPSDATNVALNLALTGSGYLSSADTSTCSLQTQSAACTLGTLATAASTTVDFTLSATALGKIGYSAQAGSDVADPQSDDDTVSGALAVNVSSAAGSAPAISPTNATQTATAAKKSGCGATGTPWLWALLLIGWLLRNRRRPRSGSGSKI